MAGPQRMLIPGDPQDRWISITWRLLSGSFGLLAGMAILVVLTGSARALGTLVVGLIPVVGAAAWLHRQALLRVDTSRRTEAESFARILQGLSRSVSPAAIVESMVGDLGRVTAADHCVVAHLDGDSGSLVATLVSMRAGVPSQTSILPAIDLVRGADRNPERVVERIAAAIEAFFGIGNTLTVPLRNDRTVIGAITLSRRSAEPWPAATQRVLAGAALEAAAALERVDSTRAMAARAATDALTGLPNRRYFEEFCGLLGRHRRSDDDAGVGVLMVDIDWFKRVNDTYGHEVGDHVLRAVATAIAETVRDGDVPARFGGEEFAVLLRHATRQVAIEVAERVRMAVDQLDLREWRVPGVSVSVGVAVGERHDEPIGELLELADRALYRAKRAGRNQVVAA
ncbi:MAG: diguanylate cyclase [Candidatus Limnocylindrales bacterium]